VKTITEFKHIISRDFFVENLFMRYTCVKSHDKPSHINTLDNVEGRVIHGFFCGWFLCYNFFALFSGSHNDL